MSYATYATAVGAVIAAMSSAVIAWVGLNILSLSAASSIGIGVVIASAMGLIYRRIGPSDSKKERIEERLE